MPACCTMCVVVHELMVLPVAVCWEMLNAAGLRLWQQRSLMLKVRQQWNCSQHRRLIRLHRCYVNTGWPLTNCLAMLGIWQLSGKCQGFYWKSGKCQGKNLVREKLPKTVYCYLHICVHSWICWTCAFQFGFGSCTVAFLPPPLTVTLVLAWYE